MSFPQLLLALTFVAALGPSLVTIIVVLGLTGWERYARVVRAEVLALREKDFIEAARACSARASTRPSSRVRNPSGQVWTDVAGARGRDTLRGLAA